MKLFFIRTAADIIYSNNHAGEEGLGDYLFQ